MNLMLPTALAVLVAELGGPLAGSIAARRWHALLMTLLVIVAGAVAGVIVGTDLIERARDMMLAIALFFAAVAQVTRDRQQAAPTTLWRALVAASRASAPLLTMTIAARYHAPVAAAIGALLGMVGAGVLAAWSIPTDPRWRVAAGALLSIATLAYGLRVLHPG